MCENVIYHIFRLKYRCFAYALSMIAQAYIVYTLYRIPKKFQNFIKFQNFSKIKKMYKFQKIKNFKNS